MNTRHLFLPGILLGILSTMHYIQCTADIHCIEHTADAAITAETIQKNTTPKQKKHRRARPAKKVKHTRKYTHTVVMAKAPHKEDDIEHSTDTKKHRRSRKKGSFSTFISTPSLNIKSMTYEQLAARVPELLEQEDIRIAGKYLKRMVTLCTDLDLKADHEIQIADLLFEREKYQKAGRRYYAFAQSNEGNKKYAEYALYKAAEAFSHCLNSFDRCQEQTHTTIKICDMYMARPLFTTYKTPVQKIQHDCYTLLVDSEMHIGIECLKLNNTKGADIHFAYVEKDLAAVFPPATLLAHNYKKAYGIEDSHIEADASILLAQQETKHVHMVDRF